MPHPKTEINPLWGIRLKEVCEQCDIRQAELAKRIFISQQTISKIINGKATLTRQTALKISEIFPQYSAEWILGLSDYKSDSDHMSQLIRNAAKTSDFLFTGLSAFAQLSGYRISGPQLITNCDDATLKLAKGYEIRKDCKLVELSPDEFRQFENEICEIVELKFKHLFQEKGVPDNG